MLLEELLAPSCAVVVDCPDSKKRVLEILAKHIAATVQTSDAETIFESYFARERLGSTGIGQGIAIPHIRSQYTDKPVAVLMRLSNPLDFKALDDVPVDLVLGLMVPITHNEEHLIILAHLAKLFSQPELCEQLRQANNDDSLLEILMQYEYEYS